MSSEGKGGVAEIKATLDVLSANESATKQLDYKRKILKGGWWLSVIVLAAIAVMLCQFYSKIDARYFLLFWLFSSWLLSGTYYRSGLT